MFPFKFYFFLKKQPFDNFKIHIVYSKYFLLTFLFYVYHGLTTHVCLFNTCVPGTKGREKKASEPQGLEFGLEIKPWGVWENSYTTTH